MFIRQLVAIVTNFSSGHIPTKDALFALTEKCGGGVVPWLVELALKRGPVLGVKLHDEVLRCLAGLMQHTPTASYVFKSSLASMLVDELAELTERRVVQGLKASLAFIALASFTKQGSSSFASLLVPAHLHILLKLISPSQTLSLGEEVQRLAMHTLRNISFSQPFKITILEHGNPVLLPNFRACARNPHYCLNSIDQEDWCCACFAGCL